MVEKVRRTERAEKMRPAVSRALAGRTDRILEPYSVARTPRKRQIARNRAAEDDDKHILQKDGRKQLGHNNSLKTEDQTDVCLPLFCFVCNRRWSATKKGVAEHCFALSCVRRRPSRLSAHSPMWVEKVFHASSEVIRKSIAKPEDLLATYRLDAKVRQPQPRHDKRSQLRF